MQLMGGTIPFYKMQGCGNDFVAVDNRALRIPEADMPRWAEKACARAFGVCADGIFFLEEAAGDDSLDYRWHFYNNDGSRAEMCGNASRCAARLAHALGLAPARHVFGTDAGPIHAEVFTDQERAGQVRVQLTDPQGLTLRTMLRVEPDNAGQDLEVHFVDSGVPHAVVIVPDAAQVDVQKLGAALRYHEHFQPAGTNVNFVQVQDRGRIICRTYERGVEAETYACGTGAVASQVIAHALDLTDEEVRVTTSGGEVLGVLVRDGHPYLQGAAELVFTGTLNLDALGLHLG